MTPASFKAWRLRLGLTQVAAADALGVAIQTVKAWEGGANPISKTVELACRMVEQDLGVTSAIIRREG